jgi:hypothetical protein
MLGSGVELAAANAIAGMVRSVELGVDDLWRVVAMLPNPNHPCPGYGGGCPHPAPI